MSYVSARLFFVFFVFCRPSADALAAAPAAASAKILARMAPCYAGMVKLKINGIPIELPYTPYPSQVVSISKLLHSFQNGSSALIESPTGTGKSLSIICSVLGYNAFVQRDIGSPDEQRKPVKIFICTRTHSQINQLIEQLRKTAYRPRISILGSKTQYCINPKLAKAEDKNTACSDLVKVGGCPYYNGRERLARKMADVVFDVEEMRTVGKKCVGCPYYASRVMAADADVIFAPYNYLVDSKIRESVDVSLSNAIVIIDEAHNIEDVCRTAGSIELTAKLVEIASNELLGAVRRSALMGDIKADFIRLFDFFKKLLERAEKQDGEAVQQQSYDSQMIIKKGREIVEELERMGVSRQSVEEMGGSLRNILGDDEAKELLKLNSIRLIEELLLVLKLLMGQPECYAFCFQRFRDRSKQYSYNFWLLDPGIVFRPLVASVRSISLLSGTLTPFSSFSSELKHSFAQQVVAPHILRSDQILVASVRRGHLNQELCGTYAVAETPAYMEQIGQIITDISARVGRGGGTLVFVPSYAFLGKLSGRVPGALIEPRTGGGVEFDKIMAAYRQRIAAGKPAVFICVYRGKAAEGINFQDEYARAVVAVGIPYPSIKDPQIALKKEYNDKIGGYTGRQWYETQAYRAVNQALGRVVRHEGDWGAIYLLDSRMSSQQSQLALSSWVTANLRKYDTYQQSVKDLEAFVEYNTSKNRNSKAVKCAGPALEEKENECF